MMKDFVFIEELYILHSTALMCDSRGVSDCSWMLIILLKYDCSQDSLKIYNINIYNINIYDLFILLMGNMNFKSVFLCGNL